MTKVRNWGRGGLFTEYINTFLNVNKRSQTSPSDVKPLRIKQSIWPNTHPLTFNKIQIRSKKTPGLRAIATLMLNIVSGGDSGNTRGHITLTKIV